MQSVVETNCSHALRLAVVLGLLDALLVIEERANLQQLLAEDFDLLLTVTVLRTPPRVERLVLVEDERPDFESDQRHEVSEAVHIVVTLTVLLEAGDTPELILGNASVLTEDFFLANHLLQAMQELGTTTEDKRLAVVHAVAVLVIANGGENQHDGNRVGMREHRLREDERRRSGNFARDVLLSGAGLTVGVSIAHVVVLVLVSLLPASPVVGSVVHRQSNYTTDVAYAIA